MRVGGGTVGTLTATALLLCGVSHGFYLPGVAPKEYADGEGIKIKAEKVDSVSTQLPFDYYSLPMCRPKKIRTEAENLGEIISGDSIKNTPYDIKMKTDMDCQVLCRMKYTLKDLVHLSRKVEENYRVNLIMDNMPAVQKFKLITTEEGGKKETEDFIYEQGYPLGEVTRMGGQTVVNLNNHLAINVLIHNDEHYSGSRVVGFEVQPYSIDHIVPEQWNKDESTNKVQCTQENGDQLGPMVISHTHLKKDKTRTKIPLSVVWTYSVEFTNSPVKWAVRWDSYLKMQDPRIHWFSILNSFMIVVFLSGMVAMILIRALHKDLQRYNREATEEDLEANLEDIGWKLVHADVFRTPENPGLFATLVGSGVQVLGMALLTLIFAALGFLSPANRGSLMTTLLLLYVFLGIVSGYTSARVYKTFGETDWQRQNLLTAVFYPGVNFVVFFLLNLLVWHTGSSGAIPFGTLFSLLVLWFGISVPLVYLGAYFGFKKEPWNFPCATNELARMIPDQPWYMQKYFVILVGGVLPFGAVFIEVFFIMSSVWLHRYYYMFGFLLLVFMILIVTSAEITIVMTYFQLCAEDWQWWWRSILTAGSASVYLFLYALLYFYTKLDIAPIVSGLIYFGYMGLICFAFFLLCATTGFFATFWFVTKIYGEIKVA